MSIRRLTRSLVLAPFQKPAHRPIARGTRLIAERLEDRTTPAPIPAITGLSPAPANTLLGETTTFSFNLTNTGDATGYSPFYMVALDTTGPDGANASYPNGDGLQTPTFTVTGSVQPLLGTVVIAGATYTNPFTGAIGNVPGFGTNGIGVGDRIYIYRLPFGSFTPGQTTAASLTVPMSNGADVGTALGVGMDAHFRDGTVPTGGTPIDGPDAVTGINPELWRLNKVYLGPEDETATGPNYKRRYRLDVDIATGQTINTLRIRDLLANSMQWTGAGQTTMRVYTVPNSTPGSGGTILPNDLTGTTAVTTTPGGLIVGNFGPRAGILGVDASLEFEFYVPRDRAGTAGAVLPQPPGTDSITDQNTGSATGTWTPADSRDGANIPVTKAAPDNGPHTLQEHSVATQKSVTALDLGGTPVSGVRPGFTLLRYDIDFQVSDYYAVDSLFLNDLLGDGQRLYLGAGFAPTLTVNNPWQSAGGGTRAGTSTGGFVGANTIDYSRQYTLSGVTDRTPSAGIEGYAEAGPSGGAFNLLAPGAIDGRTFLRFNISQELQARGLTGLLVGGEIPNGGGAPANNNPAAAFGPAQGRVTFYALVKREFADDFPSGDRSVDQGDVLGNQVPLIRGRHLDPTSLTPTGTFGTDDTGANLSIPYGQQEKRLYAINSTILGGAPSDTVNVQAGDRVTYLLTYTLPTSSFENLRFTDFPPLPVMPVAGSYTFNRDPNDPNRFTAGNVTVFVSGGDPLNDTYFGTFDPTSAGGRNPTVIPDAATNTLTMNFGSWDDPLRQSTRITLLVTFQLGDQAFASDLFLTNQLRISEGSTNAGDTTVEAIRRVEYVRPTVTVNKGVVGFNTTGRTLGGIAFPAPTSPPSFSGGPVFSAAQASAIGGANGTLADQIDADDTVRFAIVAQNTGQGDAFDVEIRDTIQAAFDRTTFANLRVYRGDGTLLVGGRVDYTASYNSGTGALVITLTDNYTAGNIGGAAEDARSGALSRGAGDAGAITNGSNTVVVLYDVTLANTVAPNQSIINTASVATYATSEGGSDLTDPAVVPGATDPTDTASVIVQLVRQAKTLVGTEVSVPGNNAGNQAVIGELVTYEVLFTLPEGVTPAAVVRDILAEGLALTDILEVEFTSGLAATGYTAGGVLADWQNNAAFLTANGLTVSGSNNRQINFSFGDIANNTNPNNAGNETVRIRYRVVVLNTNAAPRDNQAGATRNNSVRFEWTGFPAGMARVAAGQTSNSSGVASGTPTPITIVEPTVTTDKRVTNVTTGVGPLDRVRADAGDTVRYRIVLTASGTTAFDVTLSDLLPTQLTGAAVFSGTSTGTVFINGASGTVAAGNFEIVGGTLRFVTTDNIDMEAGATITVVVTGTWTGAAGNIVPNTAQARWTSLDGTPGNRAAALTGQSGVERTGDDGLLGGGLLNDYRTQDGAEIESPTLVRKTIVSTSEITTTPASPHPTAGGTADRTAVGEVVRYRLYASVAEGLSRNFQLRDNLPAGLRFVNDGSARYVFVTTGPGALTSAANGGIAALVGTTFLGDGSSLASLASGSISDTFDDSNVGNGSGGAGTGDPTLYASGQDVFFRLGDLTNTDSDVDAEFVVIEFNVLVENIAGNQAGVTRVNNFNSLIDTNNDGTPDVIDVVVDADGDGTGTGEPTVAGGTSNDATVTLVEPNVGIDKRAIATTGSVVTYRVTLTNTGANASAANDMVFTDLLPAADLDLIVGSITIAGAGGATTGTADHDDPTNRVRFLNLFLPVGGTLTITYQANVLSTPTGTGRITNTAGATFTSLTGANGFTTNFFGTLPATLGTPGTATGERTGADGVGGALNDYAVTDPESLGSLGDRVYYDRNANGVQDAGEPGLAGVPVTVRWAGVDGTFGNGDDSTVTVTTGANGVWTLSGLPVGAGQNYRVSVPTTFLGMALTDVRDNGGAANTNPDGLGGGVSAITLDGTTAAATNNRIQDFGFRDVGSIGDRVWHDQNGDGIQQPAERGIPGVRVTVVWHGLDNDPATTGDNLTVTATTDAAGNYTVGNLPAGNYTVTVNPADLPADFVQTYDLDGTGTANVAGTTLTSAQNRTDVDFGYRGTATLGDRVWYDVDGDGVQDSVATDGFEPGIAGATVTLVFGGADGDLTTSADNITYTTTTDASGNYLFTGLFGGAGAGNNYRVTVTPPAGYPTNTGDPDTTLDSTTVTRLEANEDDRTQDFGYRGPNTQGLGNFVWEDLNGNGRQDGGEPGIVGVQVELLDAAGTVLDVTTTAAGGAYSFPNLAASAAFGDYRVRFTAPTGYVFTTRNATGTTAADDSNADTATGATGLITLPAGAIDDSIDAGLYRPVSLGNRVFFDYDGDGVQDPGEPGISGVPVTVVWLGTDGVAGGVGDAADQTFTTTTGANGIWTVTNLPPGNYTVTAGTPPNGLTVLTDSLDGGGAPSAVNPVGVSTNSGVDRTDVDFGFRGTGSLGDRVWYDRDRDGVQDAGEEGFENVRVTVVWHGQDGVLGGGDDFTVTATTGVSGVYTIGNLPLGEYTVTVNPADLPGNFAQSYDLDGLGTPHTARATLDTSLPSRADVDFGYTGSASIGDRVWLDQNRNGVQDPGEYGLPGVVVRLELAGADGALGTPDDLLYTATTGANGLYTFTDLPVYGPDDPFRVTVLSVPGPVGAIAAVSDLDSPAGSGDQVANGLLAAFATRTDVDFGYAGLGRISGTVFDDANNDGIQQPGEPGIPGTVLVLEGTDAFGNAIRDPLAGGPLRVTTDANGNYQFDNLPPGTYTVVEVQPAGFLDGIDTAGTLGGTAAQGNADDDRVRAIVLPAAGVSANNNFAEIRPASVSGSVYEDRNRNNTRDPFEPGIRGVRVVLTGTDDRGNPVSLTTTTDATGNYRFDNLRPGTYTLTETQPVGFAQSGNTVGSAGGALAPRDIIRTITLAPGMTGAGYLFGEVRQPDPVPALPVPPLDPTKREFLSSSGGTVLTVPSYQRLNSLSGINPVQFVATADGPGGRYVRVFDVVNGQERFRFEPFPGFTGGMTAAVGDVTGDGIPDIVVGAGAGGGPAVVIYDGNTGQVVRSFFAFEAIFRGGVFVTTGDFNNDGVEDVAVAAGSGGGPRVRVLSAGDPTVVLADFWGINDPAFRGGARVAAGDVNADGVADLVVAAGFGGGPRVSTYDGTQLAAGRPVTLFGDFFAFEPTLTNGSYVTVGDIDGDGFADVIAGSGEGGAPRVTGFSGKALLAGRQEMVSNFFAFDIASTGGVRVATVDLDQDGRTELLVGSGPKHLPRARFFDPRTATLLDEFATDWTAAADGVFLG